MTRTVVIVEDEDNAAPLEIALSSLPDVLVQLYENGRDALMGLNAADDAGANIAAVVTDLNLPHIDGLALIDAIRSNQRYRTLPIIVISGNSHPDMPALVCQKGANAFFRKPYSPSEIRHTLEKLLHAD